MSAVIRLARAGAKKKPFYRIVVADRRAPRDGQFIEKIGSFNPLLAKDSAVRVVLNAERARHWLSVGAQPSDRVNGLLAAAGLTKTNDTTAKPRKPRKKADKLTRAEKRSAAEMLAKAAPAMVESPAPEEIPEA